MESETTNLNPTQVAESQKKCKHVPVIIVLAVLAASGIGFGGFELWQNVQKDNDINNLQADKIKSEEQKAEKENIAVENNNITFSNAAGGPYIEEGYFYVPKWNVKYKLSDDLVNYGYAVDQQSQGDSYGNYVVGLTALNKENYQEHPQAAYYNDIFSCSVVTIRTLEDSKNNWNQEESDVDFGGYKFVIHDIWREQNCTKDYMAPTDEVAKKLTQILSNPEAIK